MSKEKFWNGVKQKGKRKREKGKETGNRKSKEMKSIN
jgi:hypothetical protein